jgi:hypothetical protein
MAEIHANSTLSEHAISRSLIAPLVHVPIGRNILPEKVSKQFRVASQDIFAALARKTHRFSNCINIAKSLSCYGSIMEKRSGT